MSNMRAYEFPKMPVRIFPTASRKLMPIDKPEIRRAGAIDSVVCVAMAALDVPT